MKKPARVSPKKGLHVTPWTSEDRFRDLHVLSPGYSKMDVVVTSSFSLWVSTGGGLGSGRRVRPPVATLD